jgi:hypothetical protein
MEQIGLGELLQMKKLEHCNGPLVEKAKMYAESIGNELESKIRASAVLFIRSDFTDGATVEQIAEEIEGNAISYHHITTVAIRIYTRISEQTTDSFSDDVLERIAIVVEKVHALQKLYDNYAIINIPSPEKWTTIDDEAHPHYGIMNGLVFVHIVKKDPQQEINYPPRL